jgi:hypothetical protein
MKDLLDLYPFSPPPQQVSKRAQSFCCGVIYRPVIRFAETFISFKVQGFHIENRPDFSRGRRQASSAHDCHRHGWTNF